METGFDFSVIWNNMAHFMIGRYPSGPIGGVVLTLYLAVIGLILSSAIRRWWS
jgi:polar amino acid transport system permease protein